MTPPDLPHVLVEILQLPLKLHQEWSTSEAAHLTTANDMAVFPCESRRELACLLCISLQAFCLQLVQASLQGRRVVTPPSLMTTTSNNAIGRFLAWLCH